MADKIYRVPTIYNEMKKTTAPLTVRVPGSKSITNRSLLLAMLADGESTLRGVLFSDDSRHFLQCVQDLGFETTVDEDSYVVTVRKELGCEITCEREDGHFPFILTAHGFRQDHISIDIGHSSQFLSALLIASTLSAEDFTIRLKGTHGMAYIEMTRKMMEQFGVRVEHPAADQFRICTGQKYRALDYQIEPDVSAACYFYAMTPLLGIPVCVEHVHFESLQGDVEFLHILEEMGCTAQETENGVLLLPPAGQTDTGTQVPAFHGITVDMSSCSDQAITLAAIAPFADSPTCITGIGHIRFQESDRIHAICTELTRMGIHCEETQDSITIYPGMPHPCSVATYDDHRMAMGFALTGLRAEGIVIDDPGCCRKTFENYFEVLDQVIAKIIEM